MSFPETGVTSVKLTANIEGYVNEPSNNCDGTGEPFPLPDGKAVCGRKWIRHSDID
jgi:hypothetical protein